MVESFSICFVFETLLGRVGALEILRALFSKGKECFQKELEPYLRDTFNIFDSQFWCASGTPVLTAHRIKLFHMTEC
jgi:hypothetical protein